MSLNSSKSYKKRNMKNYYSATNDTISNSSELKKYYVKKYKDLDISVVTNKINLYQVTDFDFKNKTNEEYFDYYSKRHNGAFFVSTNKVASLYGVNNDFSNIIYGTFPDNEQIETKPTNYEYVYPLYYIEGSKGYNIKYGLTRPLFLIDIGNLKNILTLLKIIDVVTGDDKDLKEEYLMTIYNTCIVYDKNKGFILNPTQLQRTSEIWLDNELVVLFIEVFKPFILQNYGINIDGWVYNKTDDNIFHDEILLLSHEYLVIKGKKL